MSVCILAAVFVATFVCQRIQLQKHGSSIHTNRANAGDIFEGSPIRYNKAPFLKTKSKEHRSNAYDALFTCRRLVNLTSYPCTNVVITLFRRCMHTGLKEGKRRLLCDVRSLRACLCTALVVYIRAVPVRQPNDETPTDTEIFNGNIADRAEWPWAVLVKIGPFGGSICAGTMLSKRWVLSVATCVLESSQITVVVGEYDRLETNTTEQEIAVAERVIHPGFDISTLVNNVALLRLSENVIFNGNKIAAKIPAIANETIDDQVQRDRSYPCYVTGWGYYIDDNGIWTLPSVQQDLKVRIIRNKRCNELRAGLLLNTVTDDMVCYMTQRASTCAKTSEKYNLLGKTSVETALYFGTIQNCTRTEDLSAAARAQGDTGAPLMCYVNDEWTLIGVHCFKYDEIDGCRGGAKVAYRLSAHRDWISSYVLRFSD